MGKRKQEPYLDHDELCIPTPLGAHVQIRRVDDTVEDYKFLGIDANGRRLLRHADGRDVLYALIVPFRSIRIDVPAALDANPNPRTRRV